MNVVPAHVYMVLVLIMLTATLVLVMMATLEPIVKQVCHIKFNVSYSIEIRAIIVHIQSTSCSIRFQSCTQCDMN